MTFGSWNGIDMLAWIFVFQISRKAERQERVLFNNRVLLDCSGPSKGSLHHHLTRGTSQWWFGYISQQRQLKPETLPLTSSIIMEFSLQLPHSCLDFSVKIYHISHLKQERRRRREKMMKKNYTCNFTYSNLKYLSNDD